MPGLDFYRTSEPKAAAVPTPVPETPVQESYNGRAVFNVTPSVIPTPSPEATLRAAVYYNPRLDPKNFLEGPLSWDPATRLRQLLARPGIVVRTVAFLCICRDHI